MQTFTVKDFTFRIKKMNAIEMMALRHVFSFDEYDKVVHCYDALLSKVEVQVKDDHWIQVKQGQDFYPAELELDLYSIEKIIKQVLSYIASVFQQSSPSN